MGGGASILAARVTDVTRTAQISAKQDRLFFGIEPTRVDKKQDSADTNKLIHSSSASEVKPMSKMDQLRALVENKTAQGSVRLAGSRLFNGESSGKLSKMIVDKFIKRKQEVEELISLTNKIKEYIKRNKANLIKERSVVEKQIFDIKTMHDPKLKENFQRFKSRSSLSQTSFSASYLTENESHDGTSLHEDMSVPDERDWNKEVQHLRKKAGELNINNYVTKVLTEEEQERFKKISAKIPEANRVYMQYSLRKQYKQIKEAYEKWLESNAKTDQEVELPEIVVKVPRDEAETNVIHDEW